jgi:FlaG/FlaF family flagellin (archaellin)
LRRHTSPRRERNFLRDQRAFSSVVGTIFMVLVVLLVSSSVFLWTLAQNTIYNEAVDQRNQLEADRTNEKTRGYDAKYNVPINNVVSLTAIISNQGPLSVHFTTLWIHALFPGWTGYNYTEPSDIDLQPGEQKSINASMAIAGLMTSAEYVFSSWLITGRGNVVPLEGAQTTELVWANVTGGIGYVMMDFEVFNYYNITRNGTSYYLSNYPSGSSGYYVNQGGEGIAFQVIFTNLDHSRRPIVLSSASVMWTLYPVLDTSRRGDGVHLARFHQRDPPVWCSDETIFRFEG